MTFNTNNYILVELLKALEVGYTIVELIEVWHWDEDHRSNDLFKDFLKRSYVNKVEASGTIFASLLFYIFTMLNFRLAKKL